ncbi:MAG: succinyl-diaminopimelate desuccinylase [Proteobacteria bacterium]|nr:succinyl-diaminopimelate desuccinylase [Pseudomonadota bacterium]
MAALELVERLLTLVRIESVTGHERTLCDFLAAELGRSGTHALTRVGRAFALYPRARRCQHLVALVGHLDTVPPSADNPPRVEEGRVWGLGAADMKSGLALMWQLAVEPPAGATYDLAFLFYDGEEGAYEQSGLGPLLEQLDWLAEIDLAFCLEPSDNVLQLGCLGSLQAEVTFAGRPAHSARPWQGDNAIHRAGTLLTRLAALQPESVRFGDLIYREVVSATLAHGGTARNVVPDRFTLNLNYRFAPGRSLESAEQRVCALVDDERASIAFVDRCPSGAIPLDNPVLAAFRRVCETPAAPKQAWTDVARLTAAGIDAVNWGSGENAQAHQPNESTSIALLEAGEALFRRFLTTSGD